MDKEYIKGVIRKITDGKAEEHLAPATASMSEVMGAIREDALELMRKMCADREITANRTLNSVAFRCL